jgi:protein gp37
MPAWHPERLPQLAGQNEIIAVNFMGDMWAPGHQLQHIEATLQALLREPKQQFLLLTKYPANIFTAARFSKTVWLALQTRHIWWGVSISRQAECERLDILASPWMPDMRRWVSVEPMLEAIDLGPWLPTLDWVVCGPETGPGKRTFQYVWADQLWKATTQTHKKAFWFKGTGEQKWPEGMRT